ncbi:DNA double-strand break repair nuclease NurA [Leptothoe sp. PORK10 BA2]|uniref:DNA double-strand break repair nuclease NurA n=1 Tax=Leptothoe sp. PORK10 BA2 TaxID=3110254 RepID=UPI002B21F60F|nr:DNA double-strand break repair nuclease NurA [Leptothoe sp. PORK10 BA2]MEA5465893.1 DNA double-strand break repair nuclease NurA [Leptothoe sp. PORK10 BA2]
MLDLSKIAQQMQGISNHLAKEAEAAKVRIAIATQLLHQAHQQQAHLTQQLQTNQLGFAAAEPMEPLDTRVAIPAAPEAHTVIATDGSQINPSHHEIAYCYLINIGRVVLHYGQSRFPLLDSQPEVIYRPEDLYASRQWGISTEEWMGHRRTMAEAMVLGELGTEVSGGEKGKGKKGNGGKEKGEKRQGNLKGQKGQLSLLQRPPVPTLAMTDGSLVYWFLDQLPAAARDQILEPILAAWDRLRAAQVPMVGYLSASRSSEALNFLRLQSCPHDQPDCQKHCAGQTDGAPCQVFSPLRDVTLWATLLEPGQRGPLFKSSADILQLYGDHQVYFCHVHVGAEIARVEFPEWVVQDKKLFEAALSLTLTQVQKGFGYPVSLAESHNQAVVRGGDRSRFFALLEQQMLRAGLQNVGTSYKEARKRGSIA